MYVGGQSSETRQHWGNSYEYDLMNANHRRVVVKISHVEMREQGDVAISYDCVRPIDHSDSVMSPQLINPTLRSNREPTDP